MHEHPPRAEEMGRPSGGNSKPERRALVAEYFVETFPELSLAVHRCLEHDEVGSNKGGSRRRMSRK
jgi:hypothetical protein